MREWVYCKVLCVEPVLFRELCPTRNLNHYYKCLCMGAWVCALIPQMYGWIYLLLYTPHAAANSDRWRHIINV